MQALTNILMWIIRIAPIIGALVIVITYLNHFYQYLTSKNE